MSSYFSTWAWPWWSVIVVINLANLVVGAIVFKHSLDSKDGSDKKYRNWMRIMGIIFVLVAAYRSVFVSRYTAQLAWFDNVANSSLLIRIFAIAAELSFSGLIAFSMLQLNRDVPAASTSENSRFQTLMTTKSPYVLIACIFLAQFFATSGVITKSQTAFAIEETLWSLGFLAILPLSIQQLRRIYAINDQQRIEQVKMYRSSTIIIAAWCVIYCCYGLFYHLPFETWPYAIEQIRTGLPVLQSGFSAICDAFLIVNETKAYSDWGFGFLLWHSAYFSVCAWIAISLMKAPRMIRAGAKD